MDIMLKSADPAAFLLLRDIKVARSGVEFRLAVSSRGFTGEIWHALEAEELESLLVALRGMYVNLIGSALLQLHSEETKVSFIVNPRGQVLVSGVFMHYEEPVHRLEFGFSSDQSCLPEFISALEVVMNKVKA